MARSGITRYWCYLHAVGESSSRGRTDNWLTLMEEAGVSLARRRFHLILLVALVTLAIAAVVLIIVGVFVNSLLIWVGAALSVIAALGLVGSSWRRRQLIDTVRWEPGTVTFRTVEPGSVGENGQYVECDVTTDPLTDIHRVATTIGPLDAERMHVGTTMRCLIDRASTFNVLRVFPYAAPDATLPAGRVLKFHRT